MPDDTDRDHKPDNTPPAPDRGAEDRSEPPSWMRSRGHHVEEAFKAWVNAVPETEAEKAATARMWAIHDSITAPAETRALAAEERAAHHVGAARTAVEQAEARAREAERERDEARAYAEALDEQCKADAVSYIEAARQAGRAVERADVMAWLGRTRAASATDAIEAFKAGDHETHGGDTATPAPAPKSPPECGDENEGRTCDKPAGHHDPHEGWVDYGGEERREEWHDDPEAAPKGGTPEPDCEVCEEPIGERPSTQGYIDGKWRHDACAEREGFEDDAPEPPAAPTEPESEAEDIAQWVERMVFLFPWKDERAAKVRELAKRIRALATPAAASLGAGPEPSEALASMRSVMTTSARDWATNKGDAWLYGIVVGWDAHALSELAEAHDWDAGMLLRLGRLHHALHHAAPSAPRQAGREEGRAEMLSQLQSWSFKPKCGQPVTDECFAVQSYETGAWTHDPCPPVCTPSTYPTGAMERMSRRGDIEAGAAITPAAAAPLGAGPERYVTGAELERVHDAAEVLRDAASSYAEAVSTSDPLSSEDGRWLAAADKRLLSAARAWVALLPAAPNAPQAEPLAYPDGYQGPSTPGEHAAYRDGLRHGAEHERQPWLLWCGEILMSVCEREDGYPDVSSGQVRDFVLANLRMRKAASAPQGPSAAVLSELAAEFYSAGDEWAGVRLETVAGLVSPPVEPRGAPQADDDGHATMECAGDPGCGQARHVAAWMCLTCEAHRYPYQAPRALWLRGRSEASAPQGGPDAEAAAAWAGLTKEEREALLVIPAWCSGPPRVRRQLEAKGLHAHDDVDGLDARHTPLGQRVVAWVIRQPHDPNAFEALMEHGTSAASPPQGEQPPVHKLLAAAHVTGARQALREVKRGRTPEDVERDYAGPECFGGEDFPAAPTDPEPAYVPRVGARVATVPHAGEVGGHG